MMDRGKLTRNILIAMALGLALGSVVHMIAPADDGIAMVYFVNGLFDIGGKIFIASLKLMVVPLVFVSLVCGASNLSDGSSMGRIGLKNIGLYLITTASAISLALIAATTINPGDGINLATQY